MRFAALLTLALLGCQQQPASIVKRPCPEACDCDRCKCKEPCSCGTDVIKSPNVDTVAINAALDRLREDVNEIRRGLADRQAVSGGGVRNAEAKPAGYTGIAVYVAEVDKTLQELSACPPCNRFVRDARGYGAGWKLGTGTEHFVICQALATDTTPLFIAYRDGVELWRETGYAGDIDSLVRRNPRVDARSLAKATQPTFSIQPVYREPVMQWGAGAPFMATPTWCVNGVCQ